MIKILYLHGFLGQPNGRKGSLLTDCLGAEVMRVPVMPFHAMDCIKERIKGMGDRVALVGHSLGGFYATILSQKLNIPVVLLNPSVFPSKSPILKQGDILNGLGKLPSEWGLPDAVKQLKSLESHAIEIHKPQNILVLAQTGDELNYPDVIGYYSNCEHISIQGGGHDFTNLDQWIAEISIFLKTRTPQDKLNHDKT